MSHIVVHPEKFVAVALRPHDATTILLPRGLLQLPHRPGSPLSLALVLFLLALNLASALSGIDMSLRYSKTRA